jgi:hypothetical protein
MTVVAEERIADLPGPVRRGLERSGVLGMPVPDAVVVLQRGKIRTDRGGRWLPFTATEHYRLDPPTFEWNASLKIAGIGVGRAVDALQDGRGSMQVRLLGLFRVVDAKGPGIDQASLMRWLNETMWFPAVWATDVVSWEPVDDRRARGSVTVGGLNAQAEFCFDAEGRLVDFRADRRRDTGGASTLTPWSTPISAHARFSGLELPAAGSAIWGLEDGDFEYITIEVLDVQYSTNPT